MSNMISNAGSIQTTNALALDSSQGTEQPQNLKDVIAQLTKELTKDGGLDQSSPLGKMVADHMPFKGLLGDGPEQVQKGVENLIKDKLGDNFGAAQSAGVGDSGSGNGSGGGQQDLMSQTLNGLAKSSLDDLLTQQGDGSTFSDSGKGMLSKVADFMDANPSQFPKPDSGSWKNELDQGNNEKDNYLNGDETKSVRAALDMLGSQLDAKSAGNSEGVPQNSTSGLGSDDGSSQGVGESSDSSQGGNSVEDLKQLLESLLNKLEGNNGQQSDGIPEQLRDLTSRNNQQTLDSSASQTADALVQALVQGGGAQKSALS
ncbi:type III secretion protein HrpZ [Pseudomonas typographi]|uniref:Type III secretion protein HrpZ n=1 Tax=Pseudomonas typographi TaxID=2715964 RepID=A0ABR7Z2Y2_9PSED|nr:type III secretion protein HrpZ [Pseudomonas typographi]MBD1589589.1 type III secretion protein HrpZ [Pseudomonas typographi]MBD1599777.1 type III secretion protein HrpZ [Pseudomonas typographi]